MVMVVVGTVIVSLGRLSQSSTVFNTVVIMLVLFIIVPRATGKFKKTVILLVFFNNP